MLKSYMYNIKLTILTIFKSTIQWHQVIRTIVNYLMPSALPVSRIFSSSQTETRYPLNTDSLRPLLPPRPWQPPSCFLSLWIWLCRGPQVSGLIQHSSFRVWLISMFSGSIHVVAWIKISLPFEAEEYSARRMYRLWLSHPRQWTLRLFLPCGCCERCYYEHTRAVCAAEPTLTYPSTCWYWKMGPSGGCRCRYGHEGEALTAGLVLF